LTRVEREGDRYRIWTANSDLLICHLVRHHEFSELEVRAVNLEEAFLMLVTEELQ
jgi:hypothetical protein